jgi:hypothetical protein
VADLVVGEVERPVRVLVGGLLGEVRRGAEARGLRPLVLARVGDEAEDLAAALGRRGGRTYVPAQVRSGNQLISPIEVSAAPSKCSPSASAQRP